MHHISPWQNCQFSNKWWRKVIYIHFYFKKVGVSCMNLKYNKYVGEYSSVDWTLLFVYADKNLKPQTLDEYLCKLIFKISYSKEKVFINSCMSHNWTSKQLHKLPFSYAGRQVKPNQLMYSTATSPGGGPACLVMQKIIEPLLMDGGVTKKITGCALFKMHEMYYVLKSTQTSS